MKILFDNCDLGGSRTGPNTFARRLAVELSKRGHILADPSDYDVALCFIEKSQNLDTSKPFVQRLDGIWFKEHEIHTMNWNIKETYDLADHVVFQSDFDKGMSERWFGPKDSSSVIRNGIELTEVEISSDIQKLKSQYDKVFVCSSNWHRQKRLKENVELYLQLKSQMKETSCLIVLGSNPDFSIARPDVYYTNGSVPHEMCLKFYAVADWMIHLAWADHSPNVVVEALSQGCPVICSETGGTKELVQNNGLILKEQHVYNFEVFDYDNPPRLDLTQVTELPSIEVDRNSVEMTQRADEYEKVLQTAADARTN